MQCVSSFAVIESSPAGTSNYFLFGAMCSSIFGLIISFYESATADDDGDDDADENWQILIFIDLMLM